MDINNKTLAVFLVAAIVISFAGTIISLNKLSEINNLSAQRSTGYATSAGQARVNVTSRASLVFTIASINFGDGYVNTSGGYTSCSMYTNLSTDASWKNSGCVNFSTTTPSPFIIENDGNQNLNVSLLTDANATEYLGGSEANGHPSALLQYNVYDNETGSCTNNIGAGAWTAVNDSGAGFGTPICSNLKYDIATDTMQIGVKVLIPDDSYTGVRLVNFTATGS